MPGPTVRPMYFDTAKDTRRIALPRIPTDALDSIQVWRRGKWTQIPVEPGRSVPSAFNIQSRPSQTFPDRRKLMLVGAMEIEFEGERDIIGMVADEWRMESN